MFTVRQLPLLQPILRFGRVALKARRRIIAALCLSAVVAAAVFLGIWVDPGSENAKPLARIHAPLPPLTVENSEGAVDLNAFISGKRSVIVFYSPSCEACKKVLAALHPIPDALHLILVNESPDESGSGFRDAAQFHDRRRMVSQFFAAAALPTILFVDEAGVLRDGIVGLYGRGFIQRKLKNFAAHPEIYARSNQ
jgi:hypothetical protein